MKSESVRLQRFQHLNTTKDLDFVRDLQNGPTTVKDNLVTVFLVLVFQLYLPCTLLPKLEEDLLSAVPFVFAITLFSFFLPGPVQVVFQHDAHLPFILHVSDERML